MAGGEGRVQGLRKNGRKNEIDEPGSETEEAVQFTAGEPGEHQIKQPSRPAGSPMTPPPQELPELYEKQRSELNALHAKNKDLLEERDCFETQRGELLHELSDVKRVKNEFGAAVERLEKNLDARNRENEQLNELNRDLRQKVHQFAAEVGQGKKELSELSKVNERLRGDLNLARDGVESGVKTIEALKAEKQRLVGIELRCKFFEARADKLEDDLIEAREHINGLVAQQREMAAEMHEGPVATSMDEKMLPSLEDEMWGSESVNDEGTTEEARQMLDWSSPAGTEQLERSVDTSNSMQTGDSSTSNVGNKAEKPASTIASTQTLEASVEQSDLSTLERDRVGHIRGVSSSESGPTVLLEPSIKVLYVSPPTPRTDSTLFDSEPSPLSLSAHSNSFNSETRPSRALLSSIPERGVLDSGPSTTDSPPPPFAETTPELTKARLVGLRGSPLQMPWSPMTDTTLYDSEVSPPMQPVKTFGLWNRRKRPGLQGWSAFKLAEFRSGTEALHTLEKNVCNLVGLANLKDSTMQTGESATDVGGQTDEQSNQLTKTQVKRQVESGTKRAHYLSTTWLVLLIYLGLLWWFNQDDRQLWLQANDLTRKTVLALRDERWGGPSWLARTNFDAENMLGIDRAMLG
jgi:uncharacterized coiled-coil DUF342 family protein